MAHTCYNVDKSKDFRNTSCYKEIYNQCVDYNYVYDGERRVTKPSFPLQSCRSRSELSFTYRISIALVPATELSLL